MTPEFKAACREDFPTFLQKAFNILNPGQLLELRWYHLAIAHVLERCRTGQTLRQIIAMPPRCLKSITVSVAFTAWLLGRDPAVKIMWLSYSEELSGRHARDTRRLMASEFYRTIFPGTILLKETGMLLETTAGGFRHATSFGGTVTGLGADWIIIDDPSKAEDAFSKNQLDKAVNYYRTTLSTRLNDPANGRVLLVMQRLHQSDLAGFLLEQGGWNELALPALAVEDRKIPMNNGRVHHFRMDDLLDPARLNHIVLEDRKRDLGPAVFEAQYQQRPQPEGGNLIKKDWIRWYETRPDMSKGRVIQSVDTAQKTNPANDYSVITTWLKIDEQNYLIDVARHRLDFPSLRSKVCELHDRYRPERILIEDAGSGTALLQELKAVRPDILAFAICAKDPKDVRIGMSSALFESGNVSFPKDTPWLNEALAEVLGYPNAKHDDIIDSIAQYINWVRQGRGQGRFDYFFLGEAPPEPMHFLDNGDRFRLPDVGW